MFDEEVLADAIVLIAELSTSDETPGVAPDELVDRLIRAARDVLLREMRPPPSNVVTLRDGILGLIRKEVDR